MYFAMPSIYSHFSLSYNVSIRSSINYNVSNRRFRLKPFFSTSSIRSGWNHFNALQSSISDFTCRYKVPRVVKGVVWRGRTLLQRHSLIGQKWGMLPSDWPDVFPLRGKSNKHPCWPISPQVRMCPRKNPHHGEIRTGTLSTKRALSIMLRGTVPT